MRSCSRLTRMRCTCAWFWLSGMAWSPFAAGVDYLVGEGMPHTSIGSVPWESLAPGDRVLIHWRPEPYHEKWVVGRQGTPAAPITIRGVPGPGGALPVIDGEAANTRLQLDYWSEGRGVIKIGGSSIPPDVMPRHIIVENLEIRSARTPYTFIDDSGQTQAYSNNASAIYLEKGEFITVRNCRMHNCGNGFFVASSDGEPSRDILVEGNYIYDNGIVGSLFEHNSYTAAIGITFQYNRYGPLRSGAGGNNLKDRSAGLVVRYNWIEGGNRQLDLVEGDDSSAIVNDPAYHTTHVYGNILIEPAGAGNKQILHYGGDNGTTSLYRKGTLHFYHNTVVSTRPDGTTLMRLSTNDEHCDARNNVLYVSGAGNTLAMLDDTGQLDLSHNWIKPGWRDTFGSLGGTIDDDGTAVEGLAPGFVDGTGQDYRLTGDSDCIDAATGLLPEVLPEHAVIRQYSPHQAGADRPVAGRSADIGAFEAACLPGVFGDADADGDVDLADVTCVLDAFSGSFAQCPAAAADLAPCGGDGSHDLLDILAVLDSFAGDPPCPACR